VDTNDVEENDFSLNVSRYVDTFEPEPEVNVNRALTALKNADHARCAAEDELHSLLQEIGYVP